MVSKSNNIPSKFTEGPNDGRVQVTASTKCHAGKLDELVKLYFRLAFSNKEILSLLAHKHTIADVRTLRRLSENCNCFEG